MKYIYLRHDAELWNRGYQEPLAEDFSCVGAAFLNTHSLVFRLAEHKAREQQTEICEKLNKDLLKLNKGVREAYYFEMDHYFFEGGGGGGGEEGFGQKKRSFF